MRLLTPDTPGILSVVVMKNGEILAQTEQSDMLYPQYSIMKSLVALVIGRLCGEGQLTPRTTVGQLLHTGNAPISSVSLDALLSMQSGMEQALLSDDRHTCTDYLKACCAMPVQHPEADQTFLYTNACAYLAGRMAEEADGRSLEEQIVSDIFQPLGITDYALEYDPQGHVFGASGLQLRTQDLAKLGHGILSHRICSASWLKHCTRPHAFSSAGMPYGYFFWVLSDSFYMRGKWGQRCFMLPNHQAVIAVNSDMREKDVADRYVIQKLLPLLATS